MYNFCFVVFSGREHWPSSGGGVKKFEPERGHKLSTYVGWWIKKAITGTIANDTRLVRLPVRNCIN